MADFTMRKHFHITKVYGEDGGVVATFPDDSDELMMGIFINGLVHHGGYTLFEEDTGEYIIGQEPSK